MMHRATPCMICRLPPGWKSMYKVISIRADSRRKETWKTWESARCPEYFIESPQENVLPKIFWKKWTKAHPIMFQTWLKELVNLLQDWLSLARRIHGLGKWSNNHQLWNASVATSRYPQWHCRSQQFWVSVCVFKRLQAHVQNDRQNTYHHISYLQRTKRLLAACWAQRTKILCHLFFSQQRALWQRCLHTPERPIYFLGYRKWSLSEIPWFFCN